MRGIERVVAALLLAGAVASAVALPRLAAGPDSAAPVAGGATPRVTTIVEAAPLPAPKPKPKVVRVAFHPVVHIRVVVRVSHPHIAAHPIQRAPHVAPVAPDVVQTPPPAPAPTPTPVPTPSAPAQIAASVAPTVSPTPVLPSIGLGNGNGKAKGHDKGDDNQAPIVLPQVQQSPPADNGKGHGHGNGNGNGNGKGA